MNKPDVLARLRENKTALRARGVSHAALFGSLARGDNRPDSDIDIMIEIDPAAPIAGAGNIYRHDYEGVAALYVWKTLREHLPPLRIVIDEELAALGG